MGRLMTTHDREKSRPRHSVSYVGQQSVEGMVWYMNHAETRRILSEKYFCQKSISVKNQSRFFQMRTVEFFEKKYGKQKKPTRPQSCKFLTNREEIFKTNGSWWAGGILSVARPRNRKKEEVKIANNSPEVVRAVQPDLYWIEMSLNYHAHTYQFPIKELETYADGSHTEY